MRKLLDGLSKEELLDFLDDYAKSDHRFANTISVRFGNPGYDEELAKIKRAIDNALDGVNDYCSRDRWGNVILETGDIIDEIRTRIGQGHIRLAFAEAAMLYRKLLNLFEFQGECEISMEAEYCIGIMSDIADAATSDRDKKYIFEQSMMLSEINDGKNYGADYEDRLLGNAAKLVTRENRNELEEALARVNVRRFEESIKLIQLDIIQKFDDAVAVQAFINDNLQLPKIREIAFASAMSRDDVTEGERLCIEALATEERSYGISPWLYRLYSVYEMAERIDKMVETARRIVFLGSMEYYDILKSLLTRQGLWDSGYSGFLRECEAGMHYLSYMRVLAKEREFPLLLDQVRKHTREVYEYGKLLSTEYPNEVLTFFLRQINKEAKSATKRSMYKNVCDNIIVFAKMGYWSDAISLGLELTTAFRHRPAFVDELNHLNEFLLNLPVVM